MSLPRRILIAIAAITFACTAHAGAASPGILRVPTIVHVIHTTATPSSPAPASTVAAVEEPDHPGRPGTPVFIGVVVVMLVWGGLFAWRAQRRT